MVRMHVLDVELVLDEVLGQGVEQLRVRRAGWSRACRRPDRPGRGPCRWPQMRLTRALAKNGLSGWAIQSTSLCRGIVLRRDLQLGAVEQLRLDRLAGARVDLAGGAACATNSTAAARPGPCGPAGRRSRPGRSNRPGSSVRRDDDGTWHIADAGRERPGRCRRPAGAADRRASASTS